MRAWHWWWAPQIPMIYWYSFRSVQKNVWQWNKNSVRRNHTHLHQRYFSEGLHKALLRKNRGELKGRMKNKATSKGFPPKKTPKFFFWFTKSEKIPRRWCFLFGGKLRNSFFGKDAKKIVTTIKKKSYICSADAEKMSNYFNKKNIWPSASCLHLPPAPTQHTWPRHPIIDV